MSSLAAPRPPVKRVRSARLVVGLNGDGKDGVLRVREAKGTRCPREVVDDYLLSRVPADFGTAFLVEKVGEPESTYHVNLGDDGNHVCECKGFLRWGHCRHVSALLALREHGRL